MCSLAETKDGKVRPDTLMSVVGRELLLGRKRFGARGNGSRLLVTSRRSGSRIVGRRSCCLEVSPNVL